MSKSVVVLSGGMDSATLLYLVMAREPDEIKAISFAYGQKHVKELDYAGGLCSMNGIGHQVVPLDFTSLINNSALTSDMEVPEGHYSSENMKATVVPNRNMIMMSVAIGYAVNEKADAVAVGVHAGDHAVYPDCRPEFIMSIGHTAKIANEGFIDPDFQIYAPFLHLTKADIVRVGTDLGVPYEDTWSCYKGGKIHCGRCATCVERAEAFDIAGVDDPTKYEDENFWRTAVKEHQ